MLDVTIQLDRMHCNAESDSGFSSEPYLWTVFMHADINSIFLPFHRLITYTPHSNWTTRGMYPNGIDAGDDIPIPNSLGVYNKTLDDGGLDGTLFVGVMFVLLEQDSTDGDAIKAGHEAFAEACEVVLNDFIESKIMETDITPTEAEIQMMANQIQGEVEDAVREKVDWYEIFDDQDDFLGFGYRVLTHDELITLSTQSNPQETFSGLIHHEKTVQISSTPATTTTLINEYEVFGSIRAVSLDPPTSPFTIELEAFNEAVRVLKSIDDEVDKIRDQVNDASGVKRKNLIAKLQYQLKTIRPPAVKAVGRTRAAYNLRLDSIENSTADLLESSEKLRRSREERLSRLRRSSLLYKEANVATMNFKK